MAADLRSAGADRGRDRAAAFAACGDSDHAATPAAAKAATAAADSAPVTPTLPSRLRGVVAAGSPGVISLVNDGHGVELSVFERTREIGMLRTIGMTRRQARRMIRHESIITALIGAVMGLGLGLFLASLVTKAAGSDGLPLAIPVQTLAAFTLLAVVAGIGAAIMPARRASRLNVLEALQYE